jgi:hypothetical protein
MSREELIEKVGAKELFEKWHGLDSDERIEIQALLFENYCLHCGCYDGDSIRGCQCWNDE